MIRIIVLGIFAILFSCSDSEPECIQSQIDQFKQNQSDCVGAKVERYLFQGKILYAFSDGQCIADGGTSLVDEQCNNVCFIGGIAALTDCDGVPFYANAVLQDGIWEN